MEKEKTFLDELLEEAEEKEELQTEAYYDLVLMQIKNLTQQIEKNFAEAEKECKIINTWALLKNSQLSERMRFLELKLEAFMVERKEKTIDLPNGTLKMHKKPDKVEIEDIELFIRNAKPELVTVIPEQIKPSLNAIKLFLKTRPIPKGVKVIEGKEEFSYKLKGGTDAGKKEAGSGIEQETNIRAVV